MKTCPECERLARKLVNGRLSASELEVCRRHAESCAACREVLSVHEALQTAGAGIVEPPESEFRRMRRRVMNAIDARETGAQRELQSGLRGELQRDPRRGRSREGFASAAWTFLRAHTVPAAAALLIVVAGSALAGRWSAAPGRVDDELLLSAIRQQASSPAGLDGYWDEPFTCTNVSARMLPGDRLALSFDVSRHLELVTARESDLAKGVLVNAILEPAPIGARLQAMGLAEETQDVRLREAVIFTLTHDPNPVVRLKAVEVLSRHPFDPAIRDALVEALQQDPSVQMRLVALEYLAQQQAGPEILHRCIGEGWLTSDPAVLQRAVELTQAL